MPYPLGSWRTAVEGRMGWMRAARQNKPNANLVVRLASSSVVYQYASYMLLSIRGSLGVPEVCVTTQ